MDEIKIHLKYHPDFFREIYYRNGQGSIFTYDGTRKLIFVSIFFIVATIILYFISLTNPNISWLLALGSITILICLVYTFVSILKHQRWKSNIEKYLQKMSSYKIYEIGLTEKSIEVTLGSSSTIENWAVFKTAQINNDYISLETEKKELYVFPAKSMAEEEFKLLKEFVIKKVK